MSTAFRYEPLKVGQAGEIRLVRLVEPCSSSSTATGIHLEIRHFNIGETLDCYFALSYTWSTPHPPQDVTINNERLRICGNLARFLLSLKKDREHHRIRLHLMGDSSWFWCDQLCIDQENIHERNYQVGFMEHIYTNARLVVAWLGDHRSLQLAADYAVTCSVEECVEGLSVKPDFPRFYGEVPEGPFDCDTEETWAFKMLECFTAPAYWGRRWVVQEATLAKRIIFLCGIVEMTPRCLVSAWDGIDIFVDWREAAAKSRPIEAISQCSLRSQKLELLDALYRFEEHDCEKPHDRIFALMGVLKPHQKIAIDYEMPLEELWQITMAIVKDCVWPTEPVRLSCWATQPTMPQVKQMLADLGTRLGIDPVMTSRDLNVFENVWKLRGKYSSI